MLLLAYEAAPAFDSALVTRRPSGPVPLAWAAAYDLAQATEGPVDSLSPEPPLVPAWTPAIDEARFSTDIARVLRHIAAGDTYQVNYTFPLRTDFGVDPWQWFLACARQADVPYASYVDVGDGVVMSVSPELFLERRGRRVRTRPMKGTSRRGRWLAEDVRMADALVHSGKARAENVMIVDLLRNDLGRVAATGSVRVRDLCALERYPTVWQLTSTVEATVRPGIDLFALLQATFPCGSVTGAPKVRTMEIIAATEQAPRGIYTGAICLLRPGGDLVASVPIRTATLDRRSGHAVFPVGAGITADSDAAEEWAECLAKARVVRPPAIPDDASLFETLRLAQGDLVRRDAHVRRLCDSATLFGWRADPARVQDALAALAAGHPEGVWRARVFLDRDGTVRAEAVPFTPDERPWRVALASDPVDTRSPLLFNKTTRREPYDAARRARPDLDDVILWNARGQVTEGTFGNVVVELEGALMTPPVACGLLPGVFRQELLTRGDIVEGIVRVEDLGRCSRLWLVNSLREWIAVELEPA